MTYPASLRQQAAWVREALDPATPDTQRITLGDVDVEELEAAADRIEQLEERMRGAEALIVLWETRATRAEARVEAMENEAVLVEREACAAIAAKRPHHSGIEIAELIHKRSDT